MAQTEPSSSTARSSWPSQETLRTQLRVTAILFPILSDKSDKKSFIQGGHTAKTADFSGHLNKSWEICSALEYSILQRWQVAETLSDMYLQVLQDVVGHRWGPSLTKNLTSRETQCTQRHEAVVRFLGQGAKGPHSWTLLSGVVIPPTVHLWFSFLTRASGI